MRKTIATLIGAAATVTMITGAGLAQASTHPASAHRSVTRTEHFQAMNTSRSNNATRNSLVAYGGAFTAGGIDVQHANNTDTFRFAGGTFRVTHKTTGGHQHISNATCLISISQHGTYKISKGTGKYAGIRGSGHFKLSILVVAARNAHGACTHRASASQLLIQASGPVTLP
jgi:hypothetical protein